MIGLDTNVIVRFVTQDDPKQSAIANTLFDSLSSETPGYVPIVSLVETVWVLQRGYRLDHKQIVDVLDLMLQSKELIIDRKPDVVLAFKLFRDSRADFSDCLVSQISHAVGCHRVVTFDRKAAELANMEILN